MERMLKHAKLLKTKVNDHIASVDFSTRPEANR